jgi:TPP-dependent pyruvate/acetoin dehydrogenase alpha subunit
MLNQQRQIEMYGQLTRIRHVEEQIADLYSEQEMRCPVHLSIGQEAVAVGVSSALEIGDYVMSGHRAHSHYLAKGGDLNSMLAEIYGKETGCSSGKGGSMHLIDKSVGFMGATPIVASTIPIAVGMAFAAKQRGENRVVVSYFGEGSTEEGVFHEALNFAVLKKLPVIFVCENNLYSVYSPLDVRQPEGRRVSDVASGFGVVTESGDGNDVESVADITERAVARAKNGEGPSFLEFSTYRWLEHCGPNYDNDIGYRTEAEFLDWQQNDPVRKYRDLLISRGTIENKDVDQIDSDNSSAMNAAVKFAKESPFPQVSTVTTDVYSGESV